MRIHDVKGEAALDMLAEVIEPATEIFSDKAVLAALQLGRVAPALRLILKTHKRAVIQLLAALDGIPPAEYEIDLFTLPRKALEILNTPELMSLFTLQGQKPGGTTSGSATGNTGA